ncbi:unnamed protein product [Notodromas monacha]|uniref:Striatin N-terminal domain-containing protein n=1 Tax=Notodromas monacha TaxID=399045 RepID=A0A7R9G7U4_9CRUS|nr:unnamed protein product [Notodromas monacha]CAG0912590.1 unnamed protein product [Notodromas monacha]
MDETSQNQNGQIGPHGGAMGVGPKQNHEDHNQRAQYSMPGILHFIEHEWTRFEMEKAQWDVERSELQARIAFLQGERKGQENLKNDLIRRIKMLEYALKQERIKFHKLKYGVDINFDGGRAEGDIGDGIESPSSADGDLLLTTSTATSPPTVSWKQGRQLLRQYLQEIGYTDTIIDVRSARVRTLFGLNNPDGPENDSNGKAGKNLPAVNGSDPSVPGNNKRNLETQQKRGGKKVKGRGASLAENLLLDAEAVMANLDFLSGNGVEVDDDDEDDDEECLSDEERDELEDSRERKKSSKLVNEDDEMDAETEEVLNEFDFLITDGSDSADVVVFELIVKIDMTEPFTCRKIIANSIYGIVAV